MKPPPAAKRPRRRGRPTAETAALDAERIVEAAFAALESGGDFSMRGVAAALGVDPMALYHHVPGKQALLDAVLTRAFRALDRLPGRFARMPERRDRLHALAVGYLQCIAPFPQLSRQLARGPESLAHRRFERLYAAALGGPVHDGSVQQAARDLLVDYLHGAALAGRRHGQKALRVAWPLLVQAIDPADAPEA